MNVNYSCQGVWFFFFFLNLNGSWAQGKQLIAGTLGIAIHVDKDVNSILVDPVCSFAIAGNLIQKEIITGM